MFSRLECKEILATTIIITIDVYMGRSAIRKRTMENNVTGKRMD